MNQPAPNLTNAIQFNAPEWVRKLMPNTLRQTVPDWAAEQLGIAKPTATLPAETAPEDAEDVASKAEEAVLAA